MRHILQTQNKVKWLPLLVLPFLFVACYFLWWFFTPGDYLPLLIINLMPAFEISVEIGSLLALFLLHLAFFFVLRRFKANLLFSIACLLWIFYAVAQIFTTLGFLTPSLERFITNRFEFFILPIICALVICITHLMFTSVLPKWFIQTSSAVMVASAVLFLILNDSAFGLATTIYEVALGLIVLFIIVRLVLKLRKVEPHHIIFLVGAAALLYGAVYEILLGNEGLSSHGRFLAQNYALLFALLTSLALTLVTVREILESNAEKQRLIAHEIIAENQLEFQREQFGRLMKNVEATKYMRHDMRHHLAVINEYAQAGDMPGISGYLEGLEFGLTSARRKVYCDNYAVNAIASHYLTIAENEDITITVKLNVPANTGLVKDSDLCVILGNLLENATEACRNLRKEDRFIKLFSYVEENSLTITMENSFDGTFLERDGIFYSTKREGEGIGLSSIYTVAENNGGDARFETKDNVFYSSVYVLFE